MKIIDLIYILFIIYLYIFFFSNYEDTNYLYTSLFFINMICCSIYIKSIFSC